MTASGLCGAEVTVKTRAGSREVGTSDFTAGPSQASPFPLVSEASRPLSFRSTQCFPLPSSKRKCDQMSFCPLSSLPVEGRYHVHNRGNIMSSTENVFCIMLFVINGRVANEVFDLRVSSEWL